MTAVGITTAGAPPASGTTSGPAHWAGLSGVAFAGLLAGAVFMTSGEPSTSNAGKLQSWATKHTALLSAASVVTLLAVAVGLYFMTWLYSRFGSVQSGWHGTMFLVGAITFAMVGSVAAGLNACMGADAKHLNAGSLQLLDSLQENFTFPMTCAGLAVMYLAAGLLIRRTGLLPRWMAWVSWGFAVLALSVILGFVPLIGTVLWMIFSGVYLTTHQPAQG
ncbi:MAG TPA: hypothetical protein VG435_18285 [Acidimicrobiales bacterium]|jgi:hypothetical protein|nr:hypothetical protein [Acidimicrobiales bacterium]